MNRYKEVPDDEILVDEYRHYKNRHLAIPWQKVDKSWIYKLRVIAYSRYAKYLPGIVKDYLFIEDIQLRKKYLNTLGNLLMTPDMKYINQEFYEAFRYLMRTLKVWTGKASMH